MADLPPGFDASQFEVVDAPPDFDPSKHVIVEAPKDFVPPAPKQPSRPLTTALGAIGNTAAGEAKSFGGTIMSGLAGLRQGLWEGAGALASGLEALDPQSQRDAAAGRRPASDVLAESARNDLAMREMAARGQELSQAGAAQSPLHGIPGSIAGSIPLQMNPLTAGATTYGEQRLEGKTPTQALAQGAVSTAGAVAPIPGMAAVSKLASPAARAAAGAGLTVAGAEAFNAASAYAPGGGGTEQFMQSQDALPYVAALGAGVSARVKPTVPDAVHVETPAGPVAAPVVPEVTPDQLAVQRAMAPSLTLTGGQAGLPIKSLSELAAEQQRIRDIIAGKNVKAAEPAALPQVAVEPPTPAIHPIAPSIEPPTAPAAEKVVPDEIQRRVPEVHQQAVEPAEVRPSEVSPAEVGQDRSGVPEVRPEPVQVRQLEPEHVLSEPVKPAEPAAPPVSRYDLEARQREIETLLERDDTPDDQATALLKEQGNIGRQLRDMRAAEEAKAAEAPTPKAPEEPTLRSKTKLDRERLSIIQEARDRFDAAMEHDSFDPEATPPISFLHDVLRDRGVAEADIPGAVRQMGEEGFTASAAERKAAQVARTEESKLLKEPPREKGETVSAAEGKFGQLSDEELATRYSKLSRLAHSERSAQALDALDVEIRRRAKAKLVEQVKAETGGKGLTKADWRERMAGLEALASREHAPLSVLGEGNAARSGKVALPSSQEIATAIKSAVEPVNKLLYGGAPKEARRLAEHLDAKYNAMALKLAEVYKKRQALGAELRKAGKTQDQIDAVHMAILTDKNAATPKDMTLFGSAAREEAAARDALSEAIINAPGTSPEMKAVIKENLGRYLNRKFAAFDTRLAGEHERVMRDTPQGLKLRGDAIDELAQKFQAEGMPQPDAVVRANEFIDAALSAHRSKEATVPGVWTRQGDKSILMHRQDLGPATLKALGEIRDPDWAVRNTLYRQMKQLRDASVQADLITSQLGKTVWERGDAKRPLNTPAASAVFTALDGKDYYTSPDIAKFMQGMVDAPVMNAPGAYTALSIAGRFAKAMAYTIGGPTSLAVQIPGNAMLSLAAGHLPLTPRAMAATPKALMRLASDLRNPRAMWKELVTHGAVESKALSNFRESVRKGEFSLLNRLGGGIMKGFGHIVQSSDVVSRVYGYYMERELLSQLHGKEWSAERIANEAGNRTADTYPTAARATRLARIAAKNPLAGFTMFLSETPRLAANNIKHALQDAKASPIAGLDRLAAAGTAFAGLQVLAQISKESNGVTDEEDAAFRRENKYATNSTLVYTRENGQLRAYDMSPIDPWYYTRQIWNTWTNKDDSALESAANTLKQVVLPYTGGGPIMAPIATAFKEADTRPASETISDVAKTMLPRWAKSMVAAGKADTEAEAQAQGVKTITGMAPLGTAPVKSAQMRARDIAKEAKIQLDSIDREAFSGRGWTPDMSKRATDIEAQRAKDLKQFVRDQKALGLPNAEIVKAVALALGKDVGAIGSLSEATTAPPHDAALDTRKFALRANAAKYAPELEVAQAMDSIKDVRAKAAFIRDNREELRTGLALKAQHDIVTKLLGMAEKLPPDKRGVVYKLVDDKLNELEATIAPERRRGVAKPMD